MRLFLTRASMSLMTTTTTRTIDALGTKAANIAMLASIRYLQGHGWTNAAISERAADLSLALKALAPAASLRAMDDAREAMECGMVDAAEQTFQATMALAGIEAAKRLA